MKPKKPKQQALLPFVKNTLRQASFRWKARNEALVAARVERGRYLCASCGGLFGPKEIQVDHIHPVVDPKVGFTTFDDYIQRLFCPVEGYQVLCCGDGETGCHGVKTRIENEMREHYKVEKDKLPNLKKKKLDKIKKTE